MQFEEIKYSQPRSGKCSVCGKRTKRMISESATVNPFNRTEQGAEVRVLSDVDMSKGRPKTREEVAADVRAKLAAKAAEPLKCSRCE